MVTSCFAAVIIYFLLVAIDCWNVNSNDANNAKFFSVLFMVIAIFGIIALNDGFNFPTDFRVIRQQILLRQSRAN